MTPAVFLDRPFMESALADTLDGAAQRLADAPPVPSPRVRPDSGECAGYFLAVGRDPGQALDDRLDRLIGPYQGQDGALSDCLLILASTNQSIQEIERRVSHDGNFNDSHVYRLDRMAERLKQRWGFAEAMAMNTSCTSAANALLYGARLVRNGQYRQVLVLAYETPSELVMQGFGSLGLNSPSGEYRPFHAERDGLVLGEAYAGVLLTTEKTAQTCGVFLGGASGCDTSSMTSTLEDGAHVHAMAVRALREAGLKAGQIQLLKYHGTGTDSNDRAEAAAAERIFAGHSPVACCLKPWLGHTLGACGLTEVLLLMSCIRQGLPLPVLSYAADAIVTLPQQPVELPVSAPLMANFSGFGGNNACLILQGVAT